jgi:E3 ubiquitin-protein ligase NRDP1
MVTPEDTTHNCITELKTAMDILRSEISCKYDEQKREMELKYDEQKREMELRLNMQRSHMVQKEATMQSQIEDFVRGIQVLLFLVLNLNFKLS